MKIGLLKVTRYLLLSLSLCLFFVTPGYSLDGDIAKYPSQPISYINPYPAGTTGDLGCRLVTHAAEKFLGQPVVVVNKAGAAMGVNDLAHAQPDGYTIGNLPASAAFVVPFLQKVPYDPLKDFTFIGQFAGMHIGVFVKTDSPFKKWEDVINYARQNPKKLTHGTAGGKNSMQGLIMEQIARKEKIEFTTIPFPSASQTEPAVLGGHIMIGSGEFSYSLIAAGQTRVILLFREEASAEYPDLPNLKDAGYDIAAPYFFNVCAPKGVPEGIARKLEDAFHKATKDPECIEGMKKIRVPIVWRGSKEMGNYVTRNYNTFGKLIKTLGSPK